MYMSGSPVAQSYRASRVRAAGMWGVSTALATLLLALSGCDAHQDNKASAAGAEPPPPQVLFSKVTKRDVPSYLEAVASLDGYVNADIRARVRGYLSSQD